MEFKVGDKVRCVTDVERYSSHCKKGDIFTIDHFDGDLVRHKERWGIYFADLELVSNNSNFKENKMEKKVFNVLVVDKKTGKQTKNESVVAISSQDALLKAFDVDAENVFVDIKEVGKFEVNEPVQAIIVKEGKN
jgi:hypothetical protein